MPLGRALSKGKSLASGSKADLKSLAGGLIKKSSAAAGSVKKTYGNRRSLLGLPSSSKSASRSSSASKLLGSNASLRQSKISFGGGRLSLQEPEPTTPVEQGTPVRSSKRTPKPSPKMIEIGKLAKAKASSARARTSVTPVRSAKRTPKPSPKGLARSRKPATPEMRLLKRTPKPSPKAKENELFANKLKAVVRPGSSSSSSSSRPLTDRSSSKKSMTKGLKSAAAKGVNGSKLAAAKMRMSMKGEEGVRKMVRKVSGAA
jgi:hypothetical protein